MKVVSEAANDAPSSITIQTRYSQNRKIGIVAKATFLEAVRDRVLLVSAAFAVATATAAIQNARFCSTRGIAIHLPWYSD